MVGFNIWRAIAVFFLAFGLGGIGVEFLHQRFADPALIKSVTDRVTIEVTKREQLSSLSNATAAAAAAREAERLRQQKIGDQALEQFRAQSVVDDAARVMAIEELEQENARYARILAGDGRTCPLDIDAIEWLRSGNTLAPVD